MMSYKYLSAFDPSQIGSTLRPTKEKLKQEGWTQGNSQRREFNDNWKGGLRTDDRKEYDRQRHKRNYVPKGPNDKRREKNPNWKGGVCDDMLAYWRKRNRERSLDG